MAEIATYRCSDKKCLLSVHLSHDVPLWHPDAPREVRRLNVAPSARKHVLRFRSEAFCHRCRKVVESTQDDTCPLCRSQSAHEEQTNRRCPQCSRGTFSMELLQVR